MPTKLFLFTLLLVAVGMVPVSATSVDMQVSTTTPTVGGSFTVQIRLVGGPALTTSQVRMTFDKTRLQLLTAVKDSAASSATPSDANVVAPANANGAFYQVNDYASVSSSGVLHTLTFQVLAAGSSSLALKTYPTDPLGCVLYNGSFAEVIPTVAAATTITATVANTAPAISNVADQSTNEDVAKTGIAFTIGDTETAAASLTLSGTSSNTTLLPPANITFGGSGANRTVTLTPAANQNGSATITLTVSDGNLTASDTFVLTVAPVNDAPTVANVIPNQTATVGSPFTFTFAANTFADVEGATPTYAATGLPTGITFTPATRTFAGTPTAAGTATVTVTATDNAAASVGTTFTITTSTLANTTPTSSNVADQSTNEDVAKTAIAFTIGDTETAAASLTLSGTSSNATLLPPANITFGGSGANRTVTLTPAANQNGSATITLTVSDGTLTASDTFVLTVVPVNDAPTVANAIPNQTATVGSPFTFTFAANTFADVEGATLTYAATGLPTGITFTPATRTFAGTPTAAGTATVTVTATDNAAASVGASFTLTVSATPQTGIPIVGSSSGTTTATPTLNGSAAPGATVRIRDGATVIGTVTADGSGAWTWTASPPLTSGTHSLTATAQATGQAESLPTTAIVVTVPTSGGGTPSSGAKGGAGGGGCGAGTGLGLLLASAMMLGNRRRRYLRP